MTYWHTFSIDETLNNLKTRKEGLTKNEVIERKKIHGLNEITEKKGIKTLKMALSQFANTMSLLLIIAAVISLAINEEIDAIVIISILLLNSLLGFIQEYKAEKAVQALKSLSLPKTTVIREGKESLIDTKDIVPGDIVIIDTGDIAPANMRLIQSINIKVQQSHITGESFSVNKTINKTRIETPLQERECMIITGSIITEGRGIGVVTQTGMNTEIGQIAKQISETQEVKTPLEKEMNTTTKWLALIAGLTVLSVFIIGITQQRNVIQMLLTSVSMAVSAVPEGLPAVITITLAIGVQRMARKNAIVKRLSAAQALGSVTVICSDKTGTITRNEMTVTKIYDCIREHEITGIGYEPKGKFLNQKNKINPLKNENIKLILKNGILCNTSYYGSKNGKYYVIGDPTEGCLHTLGAKAGMWKEELEKENITLEEKGFTPERKKMSILVETKNEKIVYSKGAPEIILESCNKVMIKGKIIKLTEKHKKQIMGKNFEMASNALRVLAFAYKKSNKLTENQLIFLGLAGMIDPARPEIKESIKMARNAGIKIMLITGDQKTTSLAIANEVGITTNQGINFTGEELDLMTEDEFSKAVKTGEVFSRTTPEHKYRIVKELKKQGEIVAVTGDGVNDAPALKKAHIGIAMGINGTDVSKEASDMILNDDNFSTIINAVEEGRNIYNNIKKFIKFLFSANIDDISVIIIALLVGLPLPFIPLHILWMNLITDGLPAIALSFDKNNKNIMNKPPRNPKKSIMREIFIFFASAGFIAAIASITLFIIALNYETYFADFSEVSLTKARTMAISAAIFFELFFVFNCRDDKKSVWQMTFKENFLSNKKLTIAVIISILLQFAFIYNSAFQQVFKTASLTIIELLMVVGFSSIGLLVLPKYFNKEI